VSDPRCPRLDPAPARSIDAERIRQLRLGHGANCSSIGSVVDTLFATAAVGAAVFAAVVAALKTEDVKVVGKREPDRPARGDK
jgi:hypothetical protein